MSNVTGVGPNQQARDDYNLPKLSFDSLPMMVNDLAFGLVRLK